MRRLLRLAFPLGIVAIMLAAPSTSSAQVTVTPDSSGNIALNAQRPTTNRQNTDMAFWGDMLLLGKLDQGTGPNLNPATLEQGAFRTGRPSDNPLHDARSFAPGDYTAVDDIKEVYWSRTAQSNLDGRPVYVATGTTRAAELPGAAPWNDGLFVWVSPSLRGPWKLADTTGIRPSAVNRSMRFSGANLPT